MATCDTCGGLFEQNVGRGRKARFCGGACRVAWHRAHSIPAVMREGRRWVRAVGKRPIQPNGVAASVTDPGTWRSFAEVQAGAGQGFGVMLGGGLGCYDLDHVGYAEACAFMASVPERIVYAEWSVSGEGVHIFVRAPECPGSRRGGVERYTRARFIRMTGKRF